MLAGLDGRPVSTTASRTLFQRLIVLDKVVHGVDKALDAPIVLSLIRMQIQSPKMDKRTLPGKVAQGSCVGDGGSG